MTMNILDIAAIKLRCGCCAQVYEVPLRDILLSHEIVHCGCPVPYETECPPVYQVRICGDEAVNALQSAWTAVSHCAELAGGELVLLGSDEKLSLQPSTKMNGGEENVCSECA
jgi:hypothetical protein